jgi:hypothetical protein
LASLALHAHAETGLCFENPRDQRSAALIERDLCDEERLNEKSIVFSNAAAGSTDLPDATGLFASADAASVGRAPVGAAEIADDTELALGAAGRDRVSRETLARPTAPIAGRGPADAGPAFTELPRITGRVRPASALTGGVAAVGGGGGAGHAGRPVNAASSR